MWNNRCIKARQNTCNNDTERPKSHENWRQWDSLSYESRSNINLESFDRWMPTCRYILGRTRSLIFPLFINCTQTSCFTSLLPWFLPQNSSSTACICCWTVFFLSKTLKGKTKNPISPRVYAREKGKEKWNLFISWLKSFKTIKPFFFNVIV